MAATPPPFTSIAAGTYHTCALAATGAAWCWGANTGGQLGDGTTNPRSSPVPVTPTALFTSIVAGGAHTCGLDRYGAAWCWGANDFGQLGDGTMTSRTTPVAVGGNRTFASLAAGGYHTCALDRAGAAWCWGSDTYSQLGDGLTIAATLPVTVAGSKVFVAGSLTAGWAHACGLVGTAAWCWGANQASQVLTGSDSTPKRNPVAADGWGDFPALTRLASSSNALHTCGLTATGAVWCWGANGAGQLGTRGAYGYSAALGHAAIAIGGDHTCGFQANRYVECWGKGSSGQLGTGAAASTFTIPWSNKTVNARAVTAGGFHTCALDGSGTAWCWGAGGFGQLGNGGTSNQLTAVALDGRVTVRSQNVLVGVEAGDSHTCGLEKTTGAAWCWGYNGNFQLGNGTTTNSTIPVTVGGGKVFTSLAAGANHTCGLNAAGAAWCWGPNSSGQLGDGTTTISTIPVAVSGGKVFTSLAAGANHTCGLNAAGAAWCWGLNSSGQLGNGTTTNSTTPVAVNNAKVFTSLTTGGSHTCGVEKTTGAAWCWGNNGSGRLGNGTTTNSTTPVAVSGGKAFTSLTAGDSHTCGLTANGDAWCWGNNDSGTLGNSSTTSSTTPVVVSNTFFTSLSAGFGNTCGTAKDTGAAWCWGYNGSGRLGNGTTTNSTIPVAVSGGKAFTSLTAGGSHTCGLEKTTGAAWCWGDNFYSQLGNDTTTISTTPVAVGGGGAAVVPVTTSPAGALNIASLTMGTTYTCGVEKGTGAAWCWGSTGYGVRGDGSIATDPLVKSLVAGGKSFTSLTAGGSHTCGLETTGAAWCWGANLYGQLGDGTTTARATPVAISGGKTFTSVAAGNAHTCGLNAAGAAWCWGWNYYGGLGNGTTTNSTTPVAVSGGKVFTSLTAGALHTCGLETTGAAWCWGYNGNSQLGNGTTTDSTTPVAVGGGKVFTSLTAGDFHTCGLEESTGFAWCWGENSSRQLGNGSQTNSSLPVAVSGGKAFTSLTAGGSHTCGLEASTGFAWCWGNAVLGDGSSYGGRTEIVAVSGGKAFTSLTASAWGATCGVETTGAAWCWGANSDGQLGDGTLDTATRPVAVSGTVGAPLVTARTIRIANVRDASFAVSWVTDLPTTGSLRLWAPGTSTPITVADVRGNAVLSSVHLVTVDNLMPLTSYRFDVVSGEVTDDNGGGHYVATTGPTLAARPSTIDDLAPDQARGTVARRDATTPNAVLVHISASGQAGTSAPMVDLVTSTDQKWWVANLANLRTASLDAEFPVTSTTLIVVTADGGGDGTAGGSVTPTVARAGTLALTLGDQVSQPLQAGWNLVALRTTPTSPITAEAACAAMNGATAGAAVEIASWSSGIWTSHLCGYPPNNYTLEVGAGYFVKLGAPLTWVTWGTAVTAPVSRTLGVGWNLVGAATSIGTALTASATCTTLNAATAGTVVEVVRWANGGWDGYTCGVPPNDFTMRAGSGYFVRTTKTTSIAPIGIAP